MIDERKALADRFESIHAGIKEHPTAYIPLGIVTVQERDLIVAALRSPLAGTREEVALALCKSGKFETGEGTCSLLCMDQLGDARKNNCRHAAEVHGKLTDAILAALPPAPAPMPEREGMREALKQWKCPGCGGSGKYQQDAKGRARTEARGRTPDPKYQPDPVTCKVCNGDGLHPTSSAALAPHDKTEQS